LITKLRILFVHEVNYLTKPIYEMHEFPEHLALNGHEIGFWHFPEGYSSREVRSLGWKRQVPGRVVAGTNLTLFTPPIAGNLLGRLVSALLANYFARKTIEEFQPDLIVSFSVPTQGWQIISAAKKLSVPVMFRALDVSHKIRRGIFSKLIFWAESFVYRNVDWLSANNPAMLEYCQSMGAHSSKSSVDWPPIDLRRFGQANSGLDLKRQLGIPENRKIVLYMGSFFYFSGLPEVIRDFAMSSISEHLVLIGGGEQDAELRELVEKLGVKNKVTFTGFIGFEDLPDYLMLADVAINPMQPSLVADAAIPNKVIQYLASGLKVVSTRLRGLELTFGESNYLHLVDLPQDVTGRALEICRESSKSGDVADKVDLERFSLPAAIAAFDQRCRQVTSNA
jgi:glycosyltransferase involved in cell wall biosynthesis